MLPISNLEIDVFISILRPYRSESAAAKHRNKSCYEGEYDDQDDAHAETATAATVTWSCFNFMNKNGTVQT